ncbi:extracellular solute-binding protein [Phyllobacterium endophyticum]|nr:extracellular solute-binding protein [Phyllobacterium endophyticum]
MEGAMSGSNKTGLISRRALIGSTLAGFNLAALGSARTASTASGEKPAKLLVLGDNASWKGTILQDAIPAFTKDTGIDVEYVQLPMEALVVRCRAEMSGQGPTSFDIVQMGSSMVGWMHPYVEDHKSLLSAAAGQHASDFDISDFAPRTLDAVSVDGKLCGIPYRATVYILHYQKELLKAAGFAGAPATFAEFRAAAEALTRRGAPYRYGVGTCGRQGPAISNHFCPFLLSNGGSFYDLKTRTILIDTEEAIDALEYYGDLMTKHRVMPPEAVTWEWDEIIANGQNDRYAMSVTLNASGTPLNKSKGSKTAGRWDWAVVPGSQRPEESKSPFFVWSFAVPSASRNKGWAFEFIQHITSKEWARRSMEKGNASARLSVLTDPDIVETYGWTAAAAAQMKTAQANPNDAHWGSLELDLRAGISSTLQGQTTARVALRAVADSWRRKFDRLKL